MLKLPDCVSRLQSAGISTDDALALRRIAMTLHRWHELECGDSDAYKSWAIERDEDSDRHAIPGKPYLLICPHDGSKVRRQIIPDRESGAKRRLARIMARYPGFTVYVQGDPRSAALYVLRPGDLREDDDVSSVYTRGIAVYK